MYTNREGYEENVRNDYTSYSLVWYGCEDCVLTKWNEEWLDLKEGCQ